MTFHTLILIDHGLPVFVKVDHAHGTDGVAVPASNTFVLVNFHATFLNVKISG
jgi:hypothetical protein